MSDILVTGTTKGGEASAESHFLEPDFSGLTSWVLISYNWMDVREFNAGVLSARWLQARRLRSPLIQLHFLHRSCRLTLRFWAIESRKARYVVSENAIANSATRMRIETGTEGSFSSMSGLFSEFV